ncbi:hypothetical protein FAZ19_13200 [Sphingobacterium alkalisoli]|uniref:Uncharacterized protein n=1 Tax=Sphingobacterium alkalisoli TaxID=1874115 RepID=A0A4U0H301_9SPHI|nr:hypothetical protein [Sphingobacterium alkalisoli]TJY66043.1 hypothetical protein FAZ19_13200 [Sphingobacterium alkalisoli]GGH16599.1 hypothetical protein GCM10011418_19070 [Sphingobacterium alkalisoli]
MNRKIKTIIKGVAALFVIGTAATVSVHALTSDAIEENKVTVTVQDELHWFNDVTSDYEGANTPDNQEAEAGGCVQNEPGCQSGYTPQQLIDENNPEAGVKPEAIGSPAATLGLPQS